MPASFPHSFASNPDLSKSARSTDQVSTFPVSRNECHDVRTLLVAKEVVGNCEIVGVSTTVCTILLYSIGHHHSSIIAAAGPADFPKIHPLQDELKITPLSAWGKPYTPPAKVPVDPSVDLSASPYYQVRLMTGEMFLKRLAMLLNNNPPYPADAAMVERLKRIGVEPGKEFDPSKLDPGIRKGIDDAPFMVWHKFATGRRTISIPVYKRRARCSIKSLL